MSVLGFYGITKSITIPQSVILCKLIQWLLTIGPITAAHHTGRITDIDFDCIVKQFSIPRVIHPVVGYGCTRFIHSGATILDTRKLEVCQEAIVKCVDVMIVLLKPEIQIHSEAQRVMESCHQYHKTCLILLGMYATY